MKIIPPKLIFKGANIKRLFNIQLGIFWNKLSINVSPKIYEGLKCIDVKEKKFRTALEKMNKAHSRTLRRLAK